jgi:hypothetical protein
MYRSSLLHLNDTDSKALKRINRVLSKHLGLQITAIKSYPEKDVYVDVKYSQGGVLVDIETGSIITRRCGSRMHYEHESAFRKRAAVLVPFRFHSLNGL